MNLEAFKELERVLGKIEDEALPFILDGWREEKTRTTGRWWWRKTEECGTAFCPMGWAAQDHWFIERGFRLRGATGKACIVMFGELVEWEAVAALLDITEDESLFLFDVANYGRDATPTKVRLRLRAFVRSKTMKREAAGVGGANGG